MSFAINNVADWRELVPGEQVVIDDVASSWETVLTWSPQYRTAQGIRVIEETTIPAGKKSIGSHVEDRDGNPVRVHELEDAPPAPVVVPVSVTMRQARLALLRAGKLAGAQQALDAMPGEAGEEARVEFEYASELRRDHPLVQALGQALGLSASDVDALFVEASQI